MVNFKIIRVIRKNGNFRSIFKKLTSSSKEKRTGAIYYRSDGPSGVDVDGHEVYEMTTEMKDYITITKEGDVLKFSPQNMLPQPITGHKDA